MQLVQQHIIKKSSGSWRLIDDMAYRSKNLYNATLYAVRQHFFKTGEYINYYSLQGQFQNIKQSDYVSMPAKVSQQVMKMVDQNFRAFFAANKSYKNNPGKFSGRPRIPNYLDTTSGRYMLIFTSQAISKSALEKRGVLKMSGLDIEIKTGLSYNIINQVRIVKWLDSYIIEIIYTVPDIQKSDNGRYASIDLGLNNLAVISSNVIKPVIISGKPLKSINQFYNKRKAGLQSKQKNNRSYNFKKIQKLTTKRNNKIKDYMHKASRLLVNHLVSNQINTLVIGHTKNWKQDINMGKVNNQNFTQIPFNMFISMLQYKCQLSGIKVVLQEESYTSKASFIDNDPIPVYKKSVKGEPSFSGKRVKRGLYKTKSGLLINADLNGSLNILRKAIPKFQYGIEVCSTPLVIKIPQNNMKAYKRA